MNDCWAGGYGHCRLAGTLKLAVGGGGPMCWGVLIEHYHPTGVKGRFVKSPTVVDLMDKRTQSRDETTVFFASVRGGDIICVCAW